MILKIVLPLDAKVVDGYLTQQTHMHPAKNRNLNAQMEHGSSQSAIQEIVRA
jgi:hypothetical protein